MTVRRLMALGLFVLVQWLEVTSLQARTLPEMHNRLEPFTTDGCSGFPDGLFYQVNKTQWRHCCIQHDISYWQGGTIEQRRQADLALSRCVGETGMAKIGQAMYLGVRVGGYQGFPFSWHWGYGWIAERGYGPLTAAERVQVETLLKEIPANLEDLPVSSNSAVAQRRSFTGDQCLDMAVVKIQEKIGRSFEMLDFFQSLKSGPQGYQKKFQITVKGCKKPFEFSYLLLREDACLELVNEGLARMRIRPLSSNAKTVDCSF